MIGKLIFAVSICAIVLMSEAKAQSDAWSGTYMRGPVRQLSSYDVQCHDDAYHLSFEETQRERFRKQVRLISLTRESGKIPDTVFNEVAQLFGEFKYMSSISFSCGLGSKRDDSDEMTPRKFLSINIEGGHEESFEEERDECLAKGWNFDFGTKRSIRVEGDTVDIEGDKIGYCYGEREYFTVPLSDNESDEEQ